VSNPNLVNCDDGDLALSHLSSYVGLLF